MEPAKSQKGSTDLKGKALALPALVQYQDGAAEITIGGRVHPLETGEMIIMPAGIPHALSAVARFKMMLVMIKK